jgi:NADH:ubiquinone oxidoreductase subunit F (NADH-binding)
MSAGGHGIEFPTNVIFTGESDGDDLDLSGVLAKTQRRLSSILIVGPEILRFVPEILAKGADAAGNANAANTNLPTLYSITGSVAQPGVYLGHNGSTISELIDLAGGIRKGCNVHGFIAGSWSNAALPARLSTLRIDADSLRNCPHISFPVVILSNDDKIERSVAF